MQARETEKLFGFKPSFATRRVDYQRISGLQIKARDLQSGDLVLAEISEIGHHARIEKPDGRRAIMHPGDRVLLACGARYAPDQFEADCPTMIGPADLAAAGGIAGIVKTRHGKTKPPTTLTILGAVQDHNGNRMNLRQFGSQAKPGTVSVPVIAVCGTSMNSGKTYTVASLVKAYAMAGHTVAAIKVTGTGAGGDLWTYTDSGAHFVRDFTDAGFATTYRIPIKAIFDGMQRLTSEAVAARASVIILEIADGLLQQETARLLKIPQFKQMLSGVVFAASDAFGAAAGVDCLRRAGYSVQAVSGRLTQSPLAMREAGAILDVPCMTATDFQSRDILDQLSEPVTPKEVSVAA